jgi:dienelactone hydrolase
MRLLKYLAAGLAVILCGGVAYATLWVSTPYRADNTALAALQSDSAVTVSKDDLLVFEPTDQVANIGIIFYPGGKVEAEAYAPLARSLSSSGYITVITPMPLNLAVLDVNKADSVKAKFLQVSKWVIAGHSLGGAMAAKYVAESASDNSGLILLAAYPDSRNDLSDKRLPVISIYGSNDQVLNKATLDSTKNLLPMDTKFVEITGGNHGQIGSYGQQAGDGEPTISAAEQLAEVTDAILAFLAQLP